MKNIVFAALTLVVVFCVQVNAQSLKKIWEVTGLEAPESVVFDGKQKVFYVSNVVGSPVDKDGNGYISIIDEKGKVVNQKWVTGMNAPKGLGISKGKLFVADIDQISIIDIATAKIENTIPVSGATFLNDVEVASNGDVYVSDTFGGNAIYRVKDGKVDLWLKDEKLNYPNGLHIKGNEMFVASWGVVTDQQTFATAEKGKLLSVSMGDKKIKDISKSFANGDGIASHKNGFFVSDWAAGKLFFVDNNGTVKEVGSYNQGTADLALVKNTLILPQMAEGKLIAFEIK